MAAVNLKDNIFIFGWTITLSCSKSQNYVTKLTAEKDHVKVCCSGLDKHISDCKWGYVLCAADKVESKNLKNKWRIRRKGVE